MVNIFQDSRTLRLGLTPTFSLALLAAVWLALGAIRSPEWALAQGPAIRYVAPAPIGSDSNNDCRASSTPCATVQHAVDMAAFGDEIRVAAGTYTDVHASSGLTQVLYLAKTITVQGGYTTTNWSTPYPVIQRATLDAQGQGGVVYITGNVSPTLDGFIITGGDVPDRGGGIAILYASPALSHNFIINNHATQRGGGVYVIGTEAAPLLDGNWIISNSTSGNGGGIFIDDYASPTLTNNVIARNRADSNGGGIYVDFFSTPVIINNTIIANNQAPNNNWANEGIYIYNFYNNISPTIVNNIIANHLCSIEIEGTLLGGTIDYNGMWGCSPNCYCGVDPGPHDLLEDPRFVDPEHDDYHLRSDSPVIDKGRSDGAPATDFDDGPRPMCRGIDIGADEHNRCYSRLPVILRH